MHDATTRRHASNPSQEHSLMRSTFRRPFITTLALVGAMTLFAGCGDPGAHLPAGMTGSSAAYTSSETGVIDSVLGGDPGPSMAGVSSLVDDPVLSSYDGVDSLDGIETSDAFRQAANDWNENEGSANVMMSNLDDLGLDDDPMPVGSGYGNGSGYGGYGNGLDLGGYGYGGANLQAASFNGGYGGVDMMDAGFDQGFIDPGLDDGGFDAGFDPGMDVGGFDTGGFDAGFDPGIDTGGFDAGFDPGLDTGGFDTGGFDAGFGF
jgi:hypothetical protein